LYGRRSVASDTALSRSSGAALVELQIAGAGDAEQVSAVDARVRVEQIHVGAQHFLHGDHREGAAGHGQEALRVARQLELRQVRLAAGAAPEHNGEREPEVRQVGQRVSRAQRHRERRELGIDLVATAGTEARLLLGREIGPAQDAHDRAPRPP
jgi:hypothetical protein